MRKSQYQPGNRPAIRIQLPRVVPHPYENILNNILSSRAISKNSVSKPKHPTRHAIEQLLQRRSVPAHEARNEITTRKRITCYRNSAVLVARRILFFVRMAKVVPAARSLETCSCATPLAGIDRLSGSC
jgi:hypothetical protein